MVSIFLAEDQQMLNSALAMLLDLEDDFSVVGTETDSQAALEKVITLKPDVTILDIEMPGLSGLEIAKQLRLMKLDIKIIILTTFARSKYFKDALAARVNGYLLKDKYKSNKVKTRRGEKNYEKKIVCNVTCMRNDRITGCMWRFIKLSRKEGRHK